MDKQDTPSDSADSSSSWEFVIDSTTENADSTKKNSSAPSSRSSESDGISILSDCEELERWRCEEVVETAEECTDDLLFSSEKLTTLDNGNGKSANDSLQPLQKNEVTTVSDHATFDETDSPIIGTSDHVNFSYLTSVGIALILTLSIFLSPLNSIFFQYFNKNDTFEESDFENVHCPPISKYCLSQYIHNEKDAGRLIISPSEENNNYRVRSDKIPTPDVINLNKKYKGQTNGRSKNGKHEHTEFKEKQKNPTKGKNILDIETGQLEGFNKEDYKIFITKLKKKQQKLNSRAKYLKKKEKYLEAKEQELLKMERELQERSAKIKDFFRKDEKRRRHFNDKDINNSNKNSFKSKHTKERQKDEKIRIKRKDVNDTVSGEWYDQLYNAREKIRKDEHASDWLFELYNYRETKRKESKRSNKSPWMGGGVNYRSNFRR